MDYRRLFSDVARRPGQYGLDGTYAQAVAFVNGCDAGNDWGLLIGFPEWLAIRAGTEANLVWWALVPKVTARGDESGAESARLFALLDEFLEQRNGAHGASRIMREYVQRNQ